MAKFGPDTVQDLVKKRRRQVVGDGPGVGLGAPAGTAAGGAATPVAGPVGGPLPGAERVGSRGKVTPAPPALPPTMVPAAGGYVPISLPPAAPSGGPAVGSEEHAQAAGQAFEDARGAGTRAGERLEGAANRQYRNVPYETADGYKRFKRQYSDDGGVTWHDDPTGEGQFGRVYDALDAAKGLVDAAPRNMAQWYERRHPEYGDWQDIGELADMAGQLQQRWERGGLGEQAFQEAAVMLGFEDAGELREFMAAERARLPEGLSDAEGLTDAERDLRQARHANAMRMLQAQMERDIDAIYGESGSSMRAFQAADGYRRQIVDANARHELGLAQEDFMRRQADFDAKLGRYQLLSAQDLGAKQMAVQMIMQDRASQMQAFALQVNTAVAQNQQLLALSAHDQAMLESSVSMYNAISDRELGLDLAMSNEMDKAYERHVKPHMIVFEARMQEARLALDAYQTSISARMQQKQIDAQERIAREAAASAERQSFFGFLGTLIGVGAGIAISAIFPPAAPVVGALGAGGAVSKLIP